MPQQRRDRGAAARSRRARDEYQPAPAQRRQQRIDKRAVHSDRFERLLPPLATVQAQHDPLHFPCASTDVPGRPRKSAASALSA